MSMQNRLGEIKSAVVGGSFPTLLLICLCVYSLLFLFLGWATFSEDDAHVMRVAVDSSWTNPYLDGEMYKQLSAANYTPVVLTVYHLILTLLPLSSMSFLFVTLLTISLFTALVGSLVRHIATSVEAGWLAMFLVFSNLSLSSLVTRFYTIHYMVGGIFALLCLIVAIRKSYQSLPLLLCGLLLLLSMLSKEVYLAMPLIVLLIAWKDKSPKLAATALLSWLIYFVMRTLVLGFNSDGRSASGLIASLASVNIDTWMDFLYWYVKHHGVILLALLVTAFRTPIVTAKYLAISLLFVAPTLAAAHGFTNPLLHGDRLFFAFNSASAIVVALSLHQLLKDRGLVVGRVLLVSLAVLFGLHALVISQYKAREVIRADYRITQYLLDPSNDATSKTFFVPLTFAQGDLRLVQETLYGESFKATQNCRDALAVPESTLVVFDNAGEITSRIQLEKNCQPANPNVNVIIPPRAIAGVVEWKFEISDNFRGGVLFVDRAFAAPVTSYRTLILNPRPGERYQLFATKDEQWWFSDIQEIVIRD